jgi:hypothetical protein
MTVEIRQAGNEWFVEVRGEPIGTAVSPGEARALAAYWKGRLECFARRLKDPAEEGRELPVSLTRLFDRP